MLGFRWFFDEAGAPDDARYPAAVDRLKDIDGAELQLFPKTAAALAAPSAALRSKVDGWLAGGTRNRVFVMVHGFDFDVEEFKSRPMSPDDPFNGVFSPARPGAAVHAESWQPIAGEITSGGDVLMDCTVGFGWDSNCSYFGVRAGYVNGYQYAALDVAPLAARALASLLLALAGKGVPISILAHSLGTRVTCQALRILATAGQASIPERVVLINGAEYSVDARHAITRNPRTLFFSVGNRRDTWPWFGGEATHPFRYVGTVPRRVIGDDGIADLPNLADLQLDRADLISWAQARSHQLRFDPAMVDGRARGEHWSSYIHAGNRLFLTALLTERTWTPRWFRDQRAPLGFQRFEYGLLGNARIPEVPRTAAERREMIQDNTPPDDLVG